MDLCDQLICFTPLVPVDDEQGCTDRPKTYIFTDQPMSPQRLIQKERLAAVGGNQR
jgi:hypothetical protein